jgi:hypothetical protein
MPLPRANTQRHLAETEAVTTMAWWLGARTVGLEEVDRKGNSFSPLNCIVSSIRFTLKLSPGGQFERAAERRLRLDFDGAYYQFC